MQYKATFTFHNGYFSASSHSAASNVFEQAIREAAMRQQQNNDAYKNIGKSALYWEILDISPSQDRAVIIKAFRAKAKICHPDCGGKAEEFQKLNAAKTEALKGLPK